MGLKILLLPLRCNHKRGLLYLVFEALFPSSCPPHSSFRSLRPCLRELGLQQAGGETLNTFFSQIRRTRATERSPASSKLESRAFLRSLPDF